MLTTIDTNELLKYDEKKRKQTWNGTQEPMKQTASEWDPRTREQTARDRDPRTRGDEREVHGESVDNRHAELAHRDRNKWNAQTRTARSSSNLSSHWWMRCTSFSTQSNLSGERKMKSELSEAARTPLGDKEFEQVTCESDAKPDKNHELLRIECETGAKDREAETKAAVALDTKARAAFEGQSSDLDGQHRFSHRSYPSWRKVRREEVSCRMMSAWSAEEQSIPRRCAITNARACCPSYRVCCLTVVAVRRGLTRFLAF